MSTTAEPRNDHSTAIAGENLSAEETRQLYNLYLRMQAEDQIRDYFLWRLNRPVHRIENRFQSIANRLMKAVTYDG
jgi:hypothetical protein